MGFSDFIKKIFGEKKEAQSSFLELNEYCINCAGRTVPRDRKICNNCGHNQDIPIVKKQADIQTLADGVFIDFYNKDIFDGMMKLFDDFIKETYKRDIDETKHTKIYNEWILLRLALSYNLPLSHYNDHAKIKEIDEVLRKRISNILLSLYGEKHLDFMKDLFAQRGRQYWSALSDENPIKAISTMFRFIIESIIGNHEMPEYMMSLSTAKQWVSPLSYQSVRCFILIEGLIMPHMITLNKWAVQ